MSFTYDLTTNTGRMRLMIGDTNLAAPLFQDEELQSILNMTSGMESGWQTIPGDGTIPQGELLCLACAMAMDSLASRAAAFASGQSITLGDYKLVGKDQVSSLQATAQRFRDAVSNMPAWGIIEENSCDFNELKIIRSWVLRTEM